MPSVLEKILRLVEFDILVNRIPRTFPSLEVKLDPFADSVLIALVERSKVSLDGSAHVRGCVIGDLVVEENLEGVDVQVEIFKLKE